ncbi:unnamed protein product [Parnassius mnemosyne]|uniref:Reverse transcriptase domain-containing protein n=1 Tax=Parnassius mnemosyne TaxID=213953 RepID=A0AAV1LQ36_9NEOP
MINFAFTTGSIPHDWKTHIIIPILKSGKDPSSSSSYRHIAISSTLSKIMEYLVKNRLEWILENRGIIPKSQFGFRKGFSTMDSLSILVSDIRLAFSNNNFLVGVFIDVCAAYDNVVLPLLRQKMHQLNIPERITNFVSNLLSHRRILVRSEGRFLPARFTWKGLPQGSVLSPLLYSLYTHDLDRSVNYLGNVLQYADDIALFVTDASTAKATSRLSQAVNYLNNWLFEHGLSISPLKCSTVVFSRRRQIPEVSIYIENTLIPTENQVPASENNWKTLSSGFETHWNFPNCCGAIDGKHILILAPPNCGSEYFSYKGSNSIVLMAVVDFNYKFLYINVGAEGSQSDGGIFKNWPISDELKRGLLPEGLFLLGDDAFPLKPYLLKPYKTYRGPLTIPEKIFNYRLSRARRIVENAFGILMSKFRIFDGKIDLKPSTIRKLVFAACFIHNWLRESSPYYLLASAVDQENIHTGEIISGSWRTEIEELRNLERFRSIQSTNLAKRIRDRMKDYFNNDGAVPWQYRHIS